MTSVSRTQQQVQAAMKAVETAAATESEKAEMLMEIAMGLQQKPERVEDIFAAVDLYRLAMDLAPKGEVLGVARIRARMATALMAVPTEDATHLKEAKSEIEIALATLTAEGSDAEIAEAEMNLGLICQTLASMHMLPIQPAISAYQRSLRTFDKVNYPKEFSILQSNLATAFLSIPFTDQSGKMREALAVQAFEEALTVVNLIDHPNEYAMLQNNLGNALQYVSSSHRVENGFRSLEAYDEALKVRTVQDMPEEYANTIANKANCLSNLPDDPSNPDGGNFGNLAEAVRLLEEAKTIFVSRGVVDKAAAVKEAIDELTAALGPSTILERSGLQ